MKTGNRDQRNVDSEVSLRCENSERAIYEETEQAFSDV